MYKYVHIKILKINTLDFAIQELVHTIRLFLLKTSWQTNAIRKI